MENTDQQYVRFAHGVQNSFIPNQIELEPQSMEATPEALEYEFVTQHLDKPLQNEIEVLRYYKIIGGPNNDNIQSLFNASDEVEKIKSGYYINIDESLNIFKQYHDLELNPFLKFHEDSTEYIKFAQKQWAPTRNEPENILFCPETFIESDIEEAGLEIDQNESLALFNVTNSGIDYNNAQNTPKMAQNAPKKAQKESTMTQKESTIAQKESTTAQKVLKSFQEQKRKIKMEGKTAKKKLNFTCGTTSVAKQNKTKQLVVCQQDENIFNNRRTRSGKVYFSTENPHKIFKKNIVPEINTKKVLKMSNTLEVAPVLHFQNLPFPYFSSKEMQLFVSKKREEEREYLQFLEAQFHESIFEENGSILYPILTNSNFEGFTYDFSQELTNNEVIKTELFCRFWRN